MGRNKKTFYMKADITFRATDIEDAFKQLKKHFGLLMKDEDSEIIRSGEIEMGPIEIKDVQVPEVNKDYFRENTPEGFYDQDHHD